MPKRKLPSYFKTLSLIHLYLSCFFAPIALIFILSGLDLTIYLEDYFILGPLTENLLYNLDKIHYASRLSTNITDYYSETPFIIFVVFFVVGTTLTLITGVLMALKMKLYRKVALILIGIGIAVPLLILFFQ